VQKIRGATWGNSFDATTIAAVAAWARENDVDPVTDLDVLGGKLYINARWYEKKLSQLIAAGQIEYARKDWVHIDKRLEKLADSGDVDAKKESLRRLKARIAHNLSDDADAACVFRIRHRQMEDEVTGAKEHIPGKRKDPVGDSAPMETIETRAIRRAMLQLSEALPSVRVVRTDDDSTVAVADIVKDNASRVSAAPKQITPGQSVYEDAEVEHEPEADQVTANAEAVRQSAGNLFAE
jgi:hypothetical protein